MKLGVYLHGSSPFLPKTTISEHIELAKRYDKAGFDSLWFADHLIRTPDPNHSALFETWSLMAALSQHTNNIRYGTMVTPVTFRHIGVFAQMVSTVDHLTGGRLIVGLGTGWYDREHNMYDIPFRPMKERFERLELHLKILRQLWEANDPITDPDLGLSGAYLNPKPIQKYPPILLGGGGENKTFRLIAKYADMSNFGGSVEQIQQKLVVLENRFDEVGRPFSELTATINRACILGSNDVQVKEGIIWYQNRMRELGMTIPSEENFMNARLIGVNEEIMEQVDQLKQAGAHLINLTMNDPRTIELAPALTN